MEWLLTALAPPVLASGPLAASTAAISFVTALAFAGAVARLAQRVTRERTERERHALRRARAAAGVH